MSARYKVKVPPTWEQGSAVFNASASGRRETMRQNALSTYNSMRAHDGLPPVRRMPAGTKYERMAS